MFPISVIKFNEIKIGMLLAADFDGFMLGNRWLVTEKREDGSFYCELYVQGKRFPWKLNDWIIHENDTRKEFWVRLEETLENWSKKFEKKEL